MASELSIAIACDQSCEEIESLLGFGQGVKPIPRLHRDRNILRKVQLETIVGLLRDSKQADGGHDDSELEAIRELARNGATKAELLTALLGE